MNKCIKRLVESLFDDDFDDIIGDQDNASQTIGRMLGVIDVLPYCETMLKKYNRFRTTKVHSRIDGDTVCFYYKTKKQKNPIVYLDYVALKLDEAQKFIDELAEFGIRNVLLTVRINGDWGRRHKCSWTDVYKNEIDLKNINFMGQVLENIYPQNVYIDVSIRNDKLYNTIFRTNSTIMLAECFIGDKTFVRKITEPIIYLRDCMSDDNNRITIGRFGLGTYQEEILKQISYKINNSYKFPIKDDKAISIV